MQIGRHGLRQSPSPESSALHQNQADQRFLADRFKRFTIHAGRESAATRLGKIVSRGYGRRTPKGSAITSNLCVKVTDALNQRRALVVTAKTFAWALMRADWNSIDFAGKPECPSNLFSLARYPASP